MRNNNTGPNRTLVIPGEIIGEGDLKAGKNTYKRGNKIYAIQMGFTTITSNFVNVIALSGRYIPKPDDLVIGVIQSVSPTSWLVDINSPYPAPLHVNEVPWRVDFGDTARYLNFGDTILARIFLVDEMKRIQVTMKDQGSRKLSGGQIMEISPTKVPRVIGKGGSMISLIKEKTMCRLFVGQNGRIWIDGEPEKIRIAMIAIEFIERESHKLGLTESVERYLEQVFSRKGDADSIMPEVVTPKNLTKPAQPVHASPREVKSTTPPPDTIPAPDPVPPPPEPGLIFNTGPDRKERQEGTVSIPPLRPPERPPMEPPRPPVDSSTTPVGDRGTMERSRDMEKPREQILQDEEFERMTE